MSFPSTTEGFAVGGSKDGGWYEGTPFSSGSGRIVFTKNGGSAWTSDEVDDVDDAQITSEDMMDV